MQRIIGKFRIWSKGPDLWGRGHERQFHSSPHSGRCGLAPSGLSVRQDICPQADIYLTQWQAAENSIEDPVDLITKCILKGLWSLYGDKCPWIELENKDKPPRSVRQIKSLPKTTKQNKILKLYLLMDVLISWILWAFHNLHQIITHTHTLDLFINVKALSYFYMPTNKLGSVTRQIVFVLLLLQPGILLALQHRMT